MSAAVATALLVCGAAPVEAKPKNPSNSQISAAQAAKEALANKVGALTAQLAQATSELQRLQADAQLKEQKYALTMSDLAAAKDAAAQAKAAIDTAQKSLDQARSDLQNYVRTSYVDSNDDTIGGGLLTSSDPNAVLERGDYLRYLTQRHLTVTGNLDRATLAKSNADAKAKAAVQKETKLAQAAQAAFEAARLASEKMQQQTEQLQNTQNAVRVQLAAARETLATLNHQRAVYDKWAAEQRRIAAAKALAAKRAREAAAAEAAAAAAANQGNNDSGSSLGSVSNPSAPSGNWTAAKGQGAVYRAMKALGMPYAWAGGNANGPTYGVNSPGTAGWNDSQVYGFDCSGLVMYAWASQGLYLAHYAATQFSQAGSYHPSPGNFMPGDLLFWGLPGQADIHHVAIYIGNGNVIQAPYSGTVVQITPWTQVSGDYFGATRPLT